MHTQSHEPESETQQRDERRVYLEQISLLYSSTTKGLVAACVNTFVILFVLWGVLAKPLLIIWASANVVIILIAALTIALFQKDKNKEKNLERWRIVSLLRLFFSGLALGSLALFFSEEHPATHQVFYYFVIGGMMAGASAVYAIKKEMYLVYAFPVMLPMTIRFFSYDQEMFFAMGGMGTLFFVIMLSSTRSMYTTMINAIVLRFKNETLANRLLDEKQQTERANHQLTLARDEIWGEMQLARKIQTVLLPKETVIPGYRIAVCMEPNSEVGGDYYDVVNVGGKNWLVIGDVSGHGVSAGLVMMMVQTSIQISLANAPEQTPSALLQSINTVIAQNIDKLSKDKYMSINVFAVHDDGQIDFSGLHQDILIFRSASQTVETVATEGLWIGVVNDLSGMLTNSSLHLSPGDTMLLYTDGITESWLGKSTKSFSEREMFGQDRLESVLLEHGNESCSEIRDTIINSIQNCDITDDVTLMVVKRTPDYHQGMATETS